MSPLVGVLNTVNKSNTSRDKSIDEAKRRHPAGKGKVGVASYNFDWPNFDTRILTKLGRVPLKQSKDSENVFISTRSNGDFEVIKGVTQKIYLTQRFELTSPNSMTMLVRIGPNPEEKITWSDQVQFELKSNRVNVVRKDPKGVTVKASYSQIHSGKAPEGMNFGGIDILRLYRTLELASRMVAKDYFNSPELTESLTRFSDGDSLATTSFSKHKLDFSSPNFYTRPLYKFGKAKSGGKSVYVVKEKSGKLTTGKVYSMGEHTVYAGRTEKWYHNQRFVYADGITKGTLIITNSPNEDLRAKTPVEIRLGIAKKSDQFQTTSSLKIDGKTVYADKSVGTFESIIDEVSKSKKLAWRIMDEPYTRTFKLLVEGVTLIEDLFLGKSDEVVTPLNEEVATPETETKGTANKDVFVYGKDDINELRRFFDTAPDMAQKTVNLAILSLESEGTNIVHLIKKGDTRSVLLTEDNLFFEGVSFRATLGKVYTLSVTRNSETVSRRYDIFKDNGSGYDTFANKFALEVFSKGIIPDNEENRNRYLAMSTIYLSFVNQLINK